VKFLPKLFFLNSFNEPTSEPALLLALGESAGIFLRMLSGEKAPFFRRYGEARGERDFACGDCCPSPSPPVLLLPGEVPALLLPLFLFGDFPGDAFPGDFDRLCFRLALGDPTLA
jgi:hypothetical protein